MSFIPTRWAGDRAQRQRQDVDRLIARPCRASTDIVGPQQLSGTALALDHRYCISTWLNYHYSSCLA